MSELKSNYFKILLVGALLVALAGSLLFFPIRMQENYSCLYHRLFRADDLIRANSAALSGENVLAHGVSCANHSMRKSPLLRHYLNNYALFWWASLFLAFFFIYRIKKNRVHSNRG